MLYFDYTATTPIDDEVLELYINTERNFFANSTSLHKLGQRSNYLFEKASEEIKELLGIKAHNIVYTTNATEANNLGIYGIALKKSKAKIITTKIEHPSVYEVYKDLEKRGFEVVYLDVDQNGIIDICQLENALDKNTVLVSIMWVNNIVGSIQPIKRIVEVMKNFPKAKLHVDCVQGIGKILPDFSFADIDLITISAHKIYGPKGVGALIYRDSLELEKCLHGSASQYGIKPGTISVGLAVAFCKVLKKYLPKTEEHFKIVKKLNQYLRAGLSKLDYLIINSSKEASPYIISASLINKNGETLVHYLESEEIYVSTGSACSSKFKRPERTVYSITNNERLASALLRISLSHLTTMKEIDQLLEVLERAKNV
ncbi:MAG: cysteine desulfurase family protein [Bacilli bacterium]|nr:cysteine desulfurase family protein [Bacilli bacterium]